MTAWLFTWLWQGSVLGAAVALTLRCAPRLNAATRHVIWCGSLVALGWLGWASAFDGAATAINVCGAHLQPCLAETEPLLYVPTAPDFLMTIVLAAWMAVALVKLLRVLPALHAVYALRDSCRAFPANIESRLPMWLHAKSRGRRTTLMICDAAPGATVLGFEHPCIAISSALVAALTVDELDQVILHEHAHVQRRDDWSRLAQTLLLSVLWIHPAAVLISRAINRERETACDEWVVAHTRRPKVYARCLARAAELRMQMRGAATLAPALLGRRHDLVRRVERVLAMRGNGRPNISARALAVGLCVMTVVSLQLQRVRVAEIAKIMLPRVAAPMPSMYDGAKVVLAEIPVAGTTARSRVRTPPLMAGRMLDLTYKESAAPNAPNAPSLMSARIFAAAYSDASVAPFAPIALGAPIALAAPIAPTAPNQWSEIGATAKKTSIGLANVFTRAGASLARNF
jgi:beta-lactamase regulating signal transducer with metallopeptidase domain